MKDYVISSEFKGQVMSSLDRKCHTLENEIASRSVRSYFCEYEVKNTIFSIEEDFVMVSVYKTANDVAFIFKYFCTLSIIRELNHWNYQADNS